MEIKDKLGLGTMGMSFANRDSSIKTIHKALQSGINVFNTGDFYHNGESQIVLGEALKNIPREEFFISLKFGVSFTPQGAFLDVKPQNIKRHLLDSLDKMGLDYVDLYQPARQDTAIPVEDVVREIKSLIDEGYVKHIGLSEVDADTLRRAHKIHPIHSVEVEYSLLDRKIEKDLIQTAKELGVNVVVYGTVGHGILTEKIFNSSLNNPMLSRGVLAPENRQNNLDLLQQFNNIAKSLNLSMNQLALAWTQSKYDNILSLIGTTNPEHLESSIKAIQTKLSPNIVDLIEKTITPNSLKGVSGRNWVFTNGVGKIV